MKHHILVNYDTGSSFHHDEGCEDRIEGIEWNDIEVAKANLKRLEAHHQFNQDTEHSWRVTQAERNAHIEKAKKQDWYAKEYPQFTVLLTTDDGEYKLVHVSFYLGHFETLNSLEIISDQSDTKITF